MKKTVITGLLRAMGAVLCFGLAVAPCAQAVEQTSAYEVVVQTTDRVMEVIEEARGYYDSDPQRFYAAVNVVLDDVVDFNGFARGVMGKYGSKERYVALATPAEKAKMKAQVIRFTGIFRDGLVQTYAKGLLNFSGAKDSVEVLKPATEAKPGESVIIEQRIRGDAEAPYVVLYKLRQDPGGQWKLRNVTIEAVNLGKVYQSQFYAAVKQYGGDIDKVIDTWSVEPTDEAKAAVGTETAP